MSTTQTTDDIEPAAPESIPAYVRDGVERQDPETLRELATWAEQLADYRLSQPIEVGDEEELVEVDNEGDPTTKTTVMKKNACGKDNCTKCPHGPYEYLAWREGDAVKWEYIGPVDA